MENLEEQQREYENALFIANNQKDQMFTLGL